MKLAAAASDHILYTGAIGHKGQPYPGEHAAILKPGTWERGASAGPPQCNTARLVR
jgi:hypothetical protein